MALPTAGPPVSFSISISAGCPGSNLRRKLTASGSDFPVIFISAAVEETVRQEAFAAGCVAYLRKPFPAPLLIEAINKAVRIGAAGDRQ